MIDAGQDAINKIIITRVEYNSKYLKRFGIVRLNKRVWQPQILLKLKKNHDESSKKQSITRQAIQRAMKPTLSIIFMNNRKCDFVEKQIIYLIKLNLSEEQAYYTFCSIYRNSLLN